MLVNLVPLFDENLAVNAYSLFTQKKNTFINPSLLGTGSLDGASQVVGLELIESVGVDALADDKNVFIPITNISIFTDLENRMGAPHERLVLLMDNSITPEPLYIERLQKLKASGYQLAMRKLEVAKFEIYREVLRLMDYMFLDSQKIDITKARIYFSNVYPNIQLCAGNIPTMERFEWLKNEGGYQFYEGDFYRTPINKGEHEVSPLKVNYIQLLNMVNSPDFELEEAADVIGRDTALVIDLLKMVNRMTINSQITGIRHAAAMLGERELRKWLTTVVAEKLYTDKPNEVTRLSLMRAKFAENLAPLFSLASQSSELFLTGLFSVLDIILDMPIAEALEIVQVSKPVKDALIEGKGNFAPIMDFMSQYERANWQEISRQLVLNQIDEKKIYDAYIDALHWYGQMIAAK
ncbi:MAG: HDOD domain-containing protein [Lachnospiraceae bacterium]|nr:HDOD domain-containing protein [Lachnospiraceae bacterium]